MKLIENLSHQGEMKGERRAAALPAKNGRANQLIFLPSPIILNDRHPNSENHIISTMDNTMRALPSISLILIAAGMMSTLFKTAAAFNLPQRYGPRTSSAVARHLRNSIAQTNQVCAARFIQLNGCYSICERQNKCALTQLFSTSADINLSTPTAFKKESYPNALHTVVVHRNKQSLAFREGTPLVFTKSIAATYSEVLDDSVEDLDG
jgi:hypothetical protein